MNASPINAEILQTNGTQVQLRVTNPTPFDAAVRVLSEPSSKLSTPLGYHVLLDVPTIKVPAGQTVDQWVGE